MPAKSEKQRRFMGAELARKRAGKKTQTGMSEKQLEEFAFKKKKGGSKEAAIDRFCHGNLRNLGFQKATCLRDQAQPHYEYGILSTTFPRMESKRAKRLQIIRGQESEGQIIRVPPRFLHTCTLTYMYAKELRSH